MHVYQYSFDGTIHIVCSRSQTFLDKHRQTWQAPGCLNAPLKGIVPLWN